MWFFRIWRPFEQDFEVCFSLDNPTQANIPGRCQKLLSPSVKGALWKLTEQRRNP
jgi:hypothetical protein